MYKRKTRDVYHLYSNYGYGWDMELECEDYKDAKLQLETYRDNCPNALFKIVCKREII